MRSAARSDAVRAVLALIVVGVITLVLGPWLRVTNPATVSITYLLVVLLVAATSRLRVAVVTSIASVLCLNFFFLPPVGTLTIADLAQLGGAVRVPRGESGREQPVCRGSRPDGRSGRTPQRARAAVRSQSRCLDDDREPRGARGAGPNDRPPVRPGVCRGRACREMQDWDIHAAGARTIHVDKRQLTNAYAAAQATLEFDAYARTYAGHRTTDVDGHVVRLVPLRLGTNPIGVLATAGRPGGARHARHTRRRRRDRH